MKQVFLIMIGLSVFLWAPAAERFTRDAGIVTDSQTNLQWQDCYGNACPNTSDSVMTVDWISAIDYCETLGLDGEEWRLPNKKELLSIVDYSVDKPSISSVFDNTTSEYYWSSTTYAFAEDGIAYGAVYAWLTSFYGGLEGYGIKTDTYNVRCVSAGQ